MPVALLMTFAAACAVGSLPGYSLVMLFYFDHPGRHALSKLLVALGIWALLASVAWFMGRKAARRLNRLRPFKDDAVLCVGAVVLAGLLLGLWVSVQPFKFPG